MKINNKKLFVGNLSWGVTSDQLKQHFSAAGNVVDAVVLTDRATGRSKGFGFVEMATEDEAKKAVEMFNGQELDSRKMTVNVARPRPEK